MKTDYLEAMCKKPQLATRIYPSNYEFRSDSESLDLQGLVKNLVENLEVNSDLGG
jgi:hypothetical protein